MARPSTALTLPLIPESQASASEHVIQSAAPALANSTEFPGRPAEAPVTPLLGSIDLTPAGTSGEQFQTEISASVSFGGKLFVLSSGGGGTLQVTNATNPAAPVLIQRLSYGGGYVSQSVASFGDLIAVALSPENYGATAGKGLVRFYRLSIDGNLSKIADVQVGYLPDGLAFNANGTKLVVANEGEPIADYAIDRPGSIGIIDIKVRAGQVRFSYTDLGFEGITLPEGIRISGPAGTTQVTDIEPEYVTVLGNYAYVTLQENNGVAKVNLRTNRIERVFDLGAVDLGSQLVDLTDRDGPVVAPSTVSSPIFKPVLGQNVLGLRMPDGIAAYTIQGRDYFVTANEGDGRDYGNYLDEVRRNRLKALADDTTAPFTAFGSRSISIFDANSGALLWDSGNTLQTIAFAASVYDDLRSDDKGVEPEGVVVAKLNGRTYAIVSLERSTKTLLAVFDVTDPYAGEFVTSQVIAGSISPEGLKVIEASQSPTGRATLVVSNELSNTLDFLDLQALIAAPPLAGAGTFASTMLKDVPGGPTLQISSLITNGEFTSGLNPGDSPYTPLGIFDGMGAFDNGDGTYTLLVNHELGANVGYGYELGGVQGVFTGSRVSTLIVDKDIDNDASNGLQSRIIGGGLAYDEIFGRFGKITDVDQLGALPAEDLDGFKRFCSANLVEALSFGASRGFENRIYLLGEEEFAGDGGSFYALDVDNRSLHQVAGFGKGTWESATAIDTGNPNTVAVLLFDDANAPLYLWVGTKSTAPNASFLERNGLAESSGSLYTFVADLADTGLTGLNSQDLQGLGLNVPVGGQWVNLETLNPNYASLGAGDLRILAVNAGAIQLSRIEDGEVNPLNGQQAVFVSTGTTAFDRGDLYGNVYTLDFTKAFDANGRLKSGVNLTDLRVIYDGDRLTDPTTGLRNPDNLTWSADGFIYLQEDRANGGGSNIANGNFGSAEASIWKLDPSSIDLLTGQAVTERWAQIDRTAVPTAYSQSQPAFTGLDGNGVGNWESSGIIDVSALYGASAGTYFLANVQAHSLGGGNIGGANYLAEGGQIDLIHQLNTGGI